MGFSSDNPQPKEEKMIATAVIFFCLSVLIFVVTFVASHNPVPSKWVRDIMIQNIWLPFCICFAALGISLLGLAFTEGSAPLTITDFVLIFGALLLTMVVIWQIKPKKKLSQYSLQRNALAKT